MATAPLKVSCASCQARFHVAAHLVRGKVVKFRCKRCKGPIEVDGTYLPAASDTPPPPSPSPPSEAEPLFFGVSGRPSQVDLAPSQVDVSQSMRLSVSDGWEGAMAPPPSEPKSEASSAHAPKIVLTDRVLRPPPIALSMPGKRPSRPAGSGESFDDASPPTLPPRGHRPPAQAVSSSAMLPPPPRRSSAPPPPPAATPSTRSFSPSVLPPWTPVATRSMPASRGPATAPPTVVHHSEVPEDAWPGRRRSGRQRGVAALMVGAVALAFTIMAWQQFHEPKSGSEPSVADRAVVESAPSEALRAADTATRAPETAARLADTVAVAEASAAAAQLDPGAAPPPSTRASRYAGRAGGARGSGRTLQASRPGRAAAAATGDLPLRSLDAPTKVSPATDSSSSGNAASAEQAMADVMRERDFDPALAKTALQEAGREAAACKSDETAAHFARFAITFAPVGKVSSVEIEGGPLIGTNVGSCMLDAFRAAQVPTFSGAPVTVHKNLAF